VKRLAESHTPASLSRSIAMISKIIKDLTRICLMAGKDYYSFLCYIDIRKRERKRI
jgi:hypothetical protein